MTKTEMKSVATPFFLKSGEDKHSSIFQFNSEYISLLSFAEFSTVNALFFLMRLFKVAAGKAIWATVRSSRAILERPPRFFVDFFQLY
jgi:hypothetical protein